MKKSLKPEKVLVYAAMLLVAGFAIRLGADYWKILKGMNSAPFALFLLERTLEYLLPGALCAVAALLLNNRKRVNPA